MYETIDLSRNAYSKEGVKFVLTASASEMATFDNSNMRAMMCSFPDTLARPFVMRYFRPQNKEDGTSIYAPYGLRKIEALLAEHYGEENVAVVHPSNLHRFVGPKTKVIGISTMDPLGLAYVSMTYTPLIAIGGPPVNRVEFLKLMNLPVMRSTSAKKIVGGFGVWQIRDAGLQDALGIDVLVAGECEVELIDLIEKILRGEKVPRYYRTKKVYDYEKIPAIKNPACFGTVEVMRGCGRRCQFCSPDYRTKYDFPIEHILKEIEVNTRYGNDMVFLVTEDIFLYGTGPKERFVPNREKLVELFKSVANHPRVGRIGISHASLAPVVVDKKLLEIVTPLIIEKSFYRFKGRPFIGVDVGIETGSVRLMKRYMSGKALPLSVDNWPEIVVEGTGIMNDNYWYPMYTFILGFPGEREEDVLASLELLDMLDGYIVFYVPLLFVPLEEAILRNARRATLDMVSELHWEFIMECWKRNLKTWAAEKYPIVRLIGFLAYGGLLHFYHGRKSFRAMMNFLGFPGIKEYSRKMSCDYSYCFGKVTATATVNDN